MNHDVFISYTSSEREYANQVKNVLETNGYSCWIAPESIPGGSSYAVEIEKALSSCRAVVVILSDKAQESVWIPKEISRALNHKKTVIPFHIDKSQIRAPFNFFLSDAQRIDAFNNMAGAYEQLLSVLNSVVDKKCIANNDSESGIKELNKKRLIDTNLTDYYSSCKIYITSDRGELCFASEEIESYEETKYLRFDGDLKNKFTYQLEVFLANLYQVDKDMVLIVYNEFKNRVKIIPAKEKNWNAWSAGDEYRIAFTVQHFCSDMDLLYDSFHLEVGTDLEVSFFNKGKYIKKPSDPIITFNQLGLNESAVIESATGLIKLCHPQKNIRVQQKFIPQFYDGGSGGYHLKYLISE